MELNINNLSVDKNGRVSFSGLSSGIDFQSVVDSIVSAKKVPVDLLQTQVDTNKSKVAALGQLKTMLSSVKESLSTLYGAVSIGNTKDIFEAKEAYASSSRYDGGTGSSAANLIGVTVANSASVGSHSIEVLQTAKAHKVSTNEYNSQTAAVGFSNGDAFTIATTDADGDPTTVTINLSSTDTLLSVRDRINAANKGETATGIVASVVKVSDSEHYLVLTNSQTGEEIELVETSGTPLQTLGIFNGSGGYQNELQAAQTAKVRADGLLDKTYTTYETDFQTSTAATAGTGGTLSFTAVSGGASLGSFAYSATDDLNDIADLINANVTDVTATVVSDGAGYRLQIDGAAAFTMSDTGGAVADLGIDRSRRVIERDSNTIDDLFAGVTLSLYQAEAGTTINLDIERNLGQIRTAITDFVDSYNELRRFINEQRDLQTTETDTEETVATGLLFNSRALQQADSTLSAIIGAGVAGVGSNFSVLAQIGVGFIGLAPDDPYDANTLVVDDAKLDEALLNNAEDIKRMFTFEFTSSDPRVQLLGFNENTVYNSTGFTLNLQPNEGTNMFEYSEQFDNAYWTTLRGTVSADAIAGPGGTTTADGLIGDATNNTHYITETSPLTVTDGQTYTMSVYAKKGDNDSARVQLAGSQFASKTYVDVDLNAGTITDQGEGTDDVSIEDAGNGWYHISVTGTAIASGNATMEMYSMNGINTVYTGNASTVDTYFYGAQLEEASESVVRLDTFTDIRATSSIAAAEVDPFGNTNTVTQIVADTSTADHGISYDDISFVSGQQYDFVAYMKAGGTAENRAQVSLNGTAFSSNTNVNVNLANGTIVGTGAGADSASIEDVGGGWYKVTLTATAIASDSTTDAKVRPLNPTTGLSFTGDGVTPNTYVYDMKIVPNVSFAPGDYVATTDTPATGSVSTANLDGDSSGLDDGSIVVKNGVATVQDGDAEGLQLFIDDGFDLPTSVSFSYTVGVGAQMYFAIDKLLDEATGTVETEIEGLNDTNDTNEDRISEMLTRIEIQRKSLLDRFIKMETALATANQVLESLTATTNAMFGNKN